MHNFESLRQYKCANVVKSELMIDTATVDVNDHGYYYQCIYTLKNNSKTYYLSVYNGIYCTTCMGSGIQVFDLEEETLNSDVKLIKTGTGFHSQLYYEYNFGSVIDWKVKPKIYFDQVSKTIHLPVVIEHDKVTYRYITYKFTGQYFEKVKS